MRKYALERIANSKRVLICLALSILIMITGTAFSFNVRASSEAYISLEESQLIKEMIIQLADEEGKEIKDITLSSKNVYFANEKWAGYVVEFSSDKMIGYAIIFKIDNYLKMIEVFFGRHSPFFKKSGMFIYPSLGYYFVKNNGIITEVSENKRYTGLELEDDSVFYGASEKEKSDVETSLDLSYKRGSLTDIKLYGFYYGYSTRLTSQANNCANAAGLIMLNYWNKKYKNDLLKLDTSLLSDGNINYYGGTDARRDYMGILYDYMNTNWIFGAGGTLPEDCYTGFEKLIKEKGYKVTRHRNLTYSQICFYIGHDVPVFITSTDYYFSQYPNAKSLPLINYANGPHTITINYKRSWGLENAHTFVGYGYSYYSLYRDITKKVWSPVWYNPFRYVTVTEEEFFHEEFIKVADGWGGTCFFNYSQSNMYDNAAIEVYK